MNSRTVKTEEMSKEQTPIERYNCGNGDGMYDHNKGYWVRFEDVEQYAKAKVEEYKNSLNVESAEEFLKSKGVSFPTINAVRFPTIHDEHLTVPQVMEAYKQQEVKKEVLEALESLQSKLLELEQDAKTKSQNSEGYNLQYSLLKNQWIFFNNYIETEVKPKYK